MIKPYILKQLKIFACFLAAILLVVIINYAYGFKFAGPMLLEQGVPYEKVSISRDNYEKLRYGSFGSETEKYGLNKTAEYYGGFWNFVKPKYSTSYPPITIFMGIFMYVFLLIWIKSLFSRSIKDFTIGFFFVFLASFIFIGTKQNDFYSSCTDFCGVLELFILLPLLVLFFFMGLITKSGSSGSSEKHDSSLS